MTKKLLPIPSSRIVEAMPYIDKYVKPAFDTGIGEKTYQQFLGLMLLDQIILWAALEDDKLVGMATTEIMEFPAYKAVHIITAGTDNGAGFGEFHPFLQTYAKNTGARCLQFWGRKGWSRAISQIPGNNGEKYKEVYRVFSMEIDNESNDEADQLSTK